MVNSKILKLSILICFIISFINLNAQENNCLELFLNNSRDCIVYNPDSTRVDTCAQSLTKGQQFGKTF